MGLDLILQARITEKETGRCITANPTDLYDKGYFSLFWYNSHDAWPIVKSWVDIVNRYSARQFTYDDTDVPFPQCVLREMCSCLLSYGCLPEANRFEWNVDCGFWDAAQRQQPADTRLRTEKKYQHIDWDDKQWYEHFCYQSGGYLRDFIVELDRIIYENKYEPVKADRIYGFQEDGAYLIPDDFIFLNRDRQNFKKNPQAYEWEFMIVNSH